MAPCCNNTVTPRMIKAGNVSIGDRIQLEESAPVSSEVPVSTPQKEEKKEYIPVQSTNIETQGEIAGISGGIKMTPISSGEAQTMNTGKTDDCSNNSKQWSQSMLYGLNAANTEYMKVEPIPYSQMTPYMNNVSLCGTTETPAITIPQDPMTPNGYDSEIDYDSVQAFNGFLRTQIGRYMRIEQLVGSNNIENRFGFLVGVGTNFIILQEITTGNIMVIDIFSIRLTYVYYSPPVIPNI